jgi:hypothetical protein
MSGGNVTIVPDTAAGSTQPGPPVSTQPGPPVSTPPGRGGGGGGGGGGTAELLTGFPDFPKEKIIYGEDTCISNVLL